MIATELSALFTRDLTRLTQEIAAFPDDATLWQTCPGISNSAGNLVLHLEGNLREFIGRQMGGVAYDRKRDLEFSSTGLTRADLLGRTQAVIVLLRTVVPAIATAQMDAAFPGSPLGELATTRQFLLHLYAHLSYHLGQIDYARRFFTGHGAVDFATLEP